MKTSFRRLQRFLMYLGLHLLETNGNKSRRIYIKLIFVVMMSYGVLMVPELIAIKDFDTFIDSLMFGVGFTTACVKFVSLYCKETKLGKVISDITDVTSAHLFESNQTASRTILKDVSTFSNKLATAGITVSTASILTCTGVSLKLGILPFGVFGGAVININHATAYVFQIVVYTFAIYIYSLSDIVYALILAHLCAFCKVLQVRINRLVHNACQSSKLLNDGSCGESISWDYLHSEIRTIVAFQTHIMYLVKQTEDVFSYATLPVFLGISMCSCFIMYHATLFTFSDAALVKDIVLLCIAILPLSLVSYWGNRLMVDSQDIQKACYEVDFVRTDIRTRKALCLIMQRSQRSMKVTIAKFTTLSLASFLWIVKTSYSYYTVLRNINTRG